MVRLSRAEIFDPSESVAVHTMARTVRMGPELHSKRSGQIGCGAISLEQYLMVDAAVEPEHCPAGE